MTKLLALATALALAGCAQTADFKRPDLPVPTDWPQKLGAGETAPKATDWRQVFTDPRLQSLINAALEYNADMRTATARVDEARALSGIAAAERYPQIDAVGQRSASLTPADLSGTGRQLNSQRYDATLGITAFELDFWGRLKNLDAAATASYLASEHAREALRLSLIADVAGAYFLSLELKARLTLADTTVGSRAESRRLVMARRDAGLAGDLDVLTADGAWQGARAERANLARQLAAAGNALRLLVGQTPDLPAAQSLTEQKLVADVAVGLPAEVLLARPDVLAAEQKLAAAHANIAVARAAFFPRVVLTASAGTASRALSGLFAAGSGAWAFAPVLRLPLFDGGRVESAVDLAAARKDLAVAEYERVVQQAFREIADLLAARQEFAAQIQAQEANVKVQHERLRLVDARHRGGVSSYLELLDAQRETHAAQQALLVLQRQQLATTAALYKALALL